MMYHPYPLYKYLYINNIIPTLEFDAFEDGSFLSYWDYRDLSADLQIITSVIGFF